MRENPRSDPPHVAWYQRYRQHAPILFIVVLAIILSVAGVARPHSPKPTLGKAGAVPVPPQPSPTPVHLATPTVVVQPSPEIRAATPRPTATLPAPVVATATPRPTTSPVGGEFAIVLLGYGGGGHDGADLSDSIMVVIVNPARQTLALLSLPRDSWVPLLFDGKTAVYNKVNTAYALAEDPTLYPDRLARYQGSQGAGNFAADTVASLIGIPVQYYLGLDFQGFRDMIDAVGGIDVNVPDSFAAQYPQNDDPSIDASWTVVRFQQGPEHMNGERAIEFARARETLDNPDEVGDFARSRRQRLIIEAFKNRLFQPGGLLHLPQLIAIASQHVDTNYSVPNVVQLSSLLLSWKNVQIYETAVTTDNYLEVATGPDGTYILVPNSSDHSWAQVRAMARQLWADPAVGTALAATTIVVQNDSGVAGLAARVGDYLSSLGYQVGDPTTGPILENSQILVGAAEASSPLVHQLAANLGLADLTTEQTSNAAAKTLVLELGQDAASLQPTVSPDDSAPTSVDGVVQFGMWPATLQPPSADSSIGDTGPAPEPIAVTPVPVATPTAVPPDAPFVVVPNFVGLPANLAQQEITNARLSTTYLNEQTIDQVANRQYFLSIPPGHVLSQSPLPGTRVARGTRVYLAVRKA